MIESKDYDVTIVITLTTSVYFAEMERDRPITEQDAIDNAKSSIILGPEDDFEADLIDKYGDDFNISVEAFAVEI